MKTDTRPIPEIAAALRDCTNRIQGHAIVKLVKGARLTELARTVHAGTQRGRVADIRDSIVQVTIGARLTTAAILGSSSDRPLPIAATDPARLTATLRAAVTRERGAEILAPLTRSQLVAVAAHLDSSKGGTKGELVERIVERTIGFRLNSAAIRSL
jgi:hypothetical protein